MKAVVILLAVVLAAGTAVAATAGSADKTHKWTAQVVAVDSNAKTITLKADDGKEMTAPVEGKAADTLRSFAAGDRVEITCRDNDAGEHQAIVAIVKAKTEKKSDG